MSCKDLKRIAPKYPNQVFNTTIPLAVSVNHLYAFVKGKRFMTKKGQEYMKKVWNIVEKDVKSQGFMMEEGGVWLVAELTFYFPDLRRRDASNMHKLVLDSLEHICFVDDRWVLVHDKHVGLDRDNPRIEVRLYPQNYKEAMKHVERTNKEKESRVANQ